MNTRFPKGGLDHELQNTIRDNLYLRTVPVTTRAPRPDERHGTDYTFLSKDEFVELEKTGELLESGIYDGESNVLCNKIHFKWFTSSLCLNVANFEAQTTKECPLPGHSSSNIRRLLHS